MCIVSADFESFEDYYISRYCFRKDRNSLRLDLLDSFHDFTAAVYVFVTSFGPLSYMVFGDSVIF